jgi:hypothetical protein
VINGEGKMSSDRIRALEKIYAQGETSEIVDLALEKLIRYELIESKKQLTELEGYLADFENQYSLSSQAFFTDFQTGEIGDDMDYIEWASIYQMAERLKKRILILEES